MKTAFPLLVALLLGAALAGFVVARQQSALREAQTAEFAKREAALAAEQARLAQALTAAKARPLAVPTPAPAAPPQVIEVIKGDRKSTRLNSSHVSESRMPSSA